MKNNAHRITDQRLKSKAFWVDNPFEKSGQTHAGYKVIIDDRDHYILGAHILGHNAEEVTNIFALAMRFRIKIEDLKQMLGAYPTYVSDIKYMV